MKINKIMILSFIHLILYFLCYTNNQVMFYTFIIYSELYHFLFHLGFFKSYNRNDYETIGISLFLMIVIDFCLKLLNINCAFNLMPALLIILIAFIVGSLLKYFEIKNNIFAIMFIIVILVFLNLFEYVF